METHKCCSAKLNSRILMIVFVPMIIVMMFTALPSQLNKAAIYLDPKLQVFLEILAIVVSIQTFVAWTRRQKASGDCQSVQIQLMRWPRLLVQLGIVVLLYALLCTVLSGLGYAFSTCHDKSVFGYLDDAIIPLVSFARGLGVFLVCWIQYSAYKCSLTELQPGGDE